ncbi:hypothetical protein [Micromonospora maritima]|uniref:hypothetical protein n=1 Tax=Micromonospora maritima TaxID=986711 RepID=UPI00157D509B|nr:hypothetical protein [Micromonospora maritima]
MKIIRQKTGVACVALPDDELIFVDPDISDPRDVVHAVHEALPDVNVDVISHWVEEVMPTAPPLATVLERPAPRKHRGKRRPPRKSARVGAQLGSMATAAAAAAALTVVGMSVVPGAGTPPVAAAEAWENEVFARIQTGSSWDCVGTDSSDLVALCIAPDGTEMKAEAWVGPNSLTFVFSYRDQVGRVQRNTMKVFSSPGAVTAWMRTIPTEGSLPNLIQGERWVMYGSDGPRLARWAERLGKNTVLPADVAQAAFHMGLLPDPEESADNEREMNHVPSVVRTTAARIIVGDDSMPTVVSPSAEAPLPGGVEPPTAPPAAPVDPKPPAPPSNPDPRPMPDPVASPTDPTPTPPPVVITPPPAEPTAPTVPVEPTTPPVAPPQEPTDPPQEPVDQEPADGPAEPAEGGVEPGQGSAQPAPGDVLVDPIAVPDDERAPLFDEGVQTPIFSALAAEVAQKHGAGAAKRTPELSPAA